MKIEVRLYASLAVFLPEKTGGNSLTMEVNDGSTIRDLLQQMNVPKKQIKVIFLNGIHAKEGDILKDGDRVGIFPAVAGG